METNKKINLVVGGLCSKVQRNLYVASGPVCSSHPVYYGHWTISQNFQLNFIFCKVDLYIAVTLYNY